MIFYSALESAPTTKRTRTDSEELHQSDSLDDTEKVLEEIKRQQAGHNDDNLEISKSPSKLNRFDALQIEDDSGEKQQSEININEEETAANDDDEEQEENEEEEDSSEEEDEEQQIEQVRDEVLAYEKSEPSKRKNLSLVVNREELIYLLKCLQVHPTTIRENILTIGMVSETNVLRHVIFIPTRSDILMLEKVRPSTLCYNTKKSPSHQHQAKPNIFR